MSEASRTHLDSLDLRDIARHIMVDFNQMRTFTADPLIMVEGDGITLTDHEGRRYIDGLPGCSPSASATATTRSSTRSSRSTDGSPSPSPIMTTTDRALELSPQS